MRSETAQIDRNQGSARDVFTAPGNRPVPAQARDGMASSLSLRGLDRDRLAGHHGGGGSQRVSCGGSTGAVRRRQKHQLSRPRSGSECIDEAVWLRLTSTSMTWVCNPALPGCRLKNHRSADDRILMSEHPKGDDDPTIGPVTRDSVVEV